MGCSEPLVDGRHEDGRLVANRELVLARGDSPVSVEAVDAALDCVTSLVVPGEAWALSVRSRWRSDRRPGLPCRPADRRLREQHHRDPVRLRERTSATAGVFTAGRVGFTSSDGDALKVIEAYIVRSPNNPLSRFIPGLRRLEDPILLRALDRRSEQPRSR